MGRTRMGFSFSLLLYFLHLYRARGDNCNSLPLQDLTCYNDYDHTITCVWNESPVCDHTDDVCTVQAEQVEEKRRYRSTRPYTTSCDLKPFDASNSASKSFSLVFKGNYIFMSYHELSIKANCTHSKQIQNMSYKPSSHIKLNPPGKPNVNQTTVTWLTQVKKHYRIGRFHSQLQWKQKDKSWNDPSVKTKDPRCERSCEVQLDPSLLIKDETYEARVRVKVSEHGLNGTWSDWSPTESWVSPVGTQKPISEWGMGVTRTGVLTLAALGLLLTGVVLIIRKKTLIYMVKSFKDPPLPDPGKSEIFQDWFTLNSKDKGDSLGSKPERSAVQTWLGSHFTGEYVQSFFSSVDIASYEVTSTVDAVQFCKPTVKRITESDNYNSSCSSFSNPSYSELCTSSCVPTDKLQACVVDAPYKPVGGPAEEKNTEHDCKLVAKKDLEMVKLLFMSGNEKVSVVVSDYEKVKKQQAERHRLHSVDSGMCSCEEVSQESIEADSINMSDGQDEETPHKGQIEEEDKEGNETKLDFQTLFGGSGSILGKNSIQICSGYKKIPGLQTSGWQDVSMTAEENKRQEDRTDEDDKPSETTCFLFPPHPPITLPQQHLNICESTSSPLLPTLHVNDFLKQIALSGSAQQQSCDDGYMPVRQKET